MSFFFSSYATTSNPVKPKILFKGAEYDSVEQGTWNGVGVNNEMAIYNTGFASGDGVNFKAYLPAGNYKASVCCYTGTDCGICKVDVDGVTKTTKDYYWGTPNIPIVSGGGTEFTLTEGIHTFKVWTNTKNAASSAYKLPIYYLIIYPSS
jgi:hypothetical protein